jgi:hypothetical protein
MRRAGLVLLWAASLAYVVWATHRWFHSRGLTVSTGATYAAMTGSYVWYTIKMGKFFLLFFYQSF